MIVMSFRTQENQKAVLDKAIEYFVDDVGWKIAEQDSCCVIFRDNKAGYVSLTFSQEEREIEVNVETRDYEYNVKEFVSRFK
jgi:hypothetical protein